MQNLRRVSKIVPEDKVPVEGATLYKWHCLGKFPSIFVKLSGALFVDLDELAAVIEKHRG
jgi:hypothetical protein